MFTPTINRVVIEELPEEETKVGSIIVAAQTKNHRKGKIVAAGPGNWDKNAYMPMHSKVGDIVIYPKGIGFDLDLNGKHYHVIYDTEIIVVLDEK